MTTIHRHVRFAGGLHWHWREVGESRHGPPLVLLHPSPRSSAMYEPWMKLLAPFFRVIAVDTPGYGGSDPLPVPAAAIDDYVAPLHALLQALAVPRCLLYGSATGAQIAIRYALTHPGAVLHLLLDNAAHFDADERAELLANYFPDLAPQPDGSHLQRAWQLCAAMAEFFPWYRADEAHRVGPPAAAAAVQTALAELLAAGPRWAEAYRAAFAHERAEHVQALTVPTTLLRWAGSPLRRPIERLLAHPLPPNVVPLGIPAPQHERLAAMTQHLRHLGPRC